MKTKNCRMSLAEKVFVIICFIITFIFFTNVLLIFVPSLIILMIFNNHLINNNISIKKEKSFLYAFILVFFVYMGIHFYIKFWLNIDTYTLNQIRLKVQLPLTMTILLGYLFKIRARDFNWNISFKIVGIIILIFLPFLLKTNIDTLIKHSSNFYYLRNFIQQIYYPSIVEEVIFRGYLLNGLLAFNIREDKSNIIQSIIFGLIHIIGYKEISLAVIMSTSIRMFIGYIFGKIYLNTKSLTPGIILHALIDTI